MAMSKLSCGHEECEGAARSGCVDLREFLGEYHGEMDWSLWRQAQGCRLKELCWWFLLGRCPKQSKTSIIWIHLISFNLISFDHIRYWWYWMLAPHLSTSSRGHMMVHGNDFGAKPQVWRGTDLFFNLIFFMETWLKALSRSSWWRLVKTCGRGHVLWPIVAPVDEQLSALCHWHDHSGNLYYTYVYICIYIYMHLYIIFLQKCTNVGSVHCRSHVSCQAWRSVHQ